MAVTPTGEVHLAGRFNGTASFSRTNLTSGNLLWSMHLERPAGEPADSGLGAAIDANGSLLLTGSARPGSKFKNVPSPSGTGSLFVALIENGDTVWVKRAGTEGGTASGDFGVGIGQDRAGNIYFGGTLGRNEPGTSALFDGLTPPTAGQRDVFVAKLGGTLPTPEPTLAFTWTGGQLSLSWPLATPDFGVQSSPSLAGVFVPVLAPRVANTASQTITVTLTPSGSQIFYRLLSL